MKLVRELVLIPQASAHEPLAFTKDAEAEETAERHFDTDDLPRLAVLPAFAYQHPLNLHRAGSFGGGPERKAFVNFSGAQDDSHLIELWLAGRPETTQQAYRFTVTHFLNFAADRKVSVRDTTVSDLVAWIDSLDGAPASKARHVSGIKSLLTFAKRTGYAPFNVGEAVQCPRVPDTLHERIVEEDDVQDVIKHATTPRDRALVLTLYYSGARISEVCGLRFRDVRGAHATFVKAKGSRVRTVLLPKAVVQALLALRDPKDTDTTPIFRSVRGKPMSRGTAYFVVKQVTDAAGVEMSPHWFRHAHATHTLDAGAPIHVVQKSLGHKSLNTTSRYVHIRPGQGSSGYLRPIET